MPKLTATGSRFEAFMEGWLIAPDAGCSTHGFAYLEILEVTGVSSLTVKGDLTGMLTGDERFWIFAPPHVSAQTGAIRGTYTGSTFKPAKCDSRYLWAQYRYMPPMAGYEVNPGTPGIYGRQPGTNTAGTYHAWNRQYDPGTGRWTTPDPAMSPWRNLWVYSTLGPLHHADPSGLGTKEQAEADSCYNEGDLWSPDASKGACHDRPIGGVLMRLNQKSCSPRLEIFQDSTHLPAGYEVGVKEAIQKRIDYLFNNGGVEPEPKPDANQDSTGESIALGLWVLRETGKDHSAKKRVGKAMAIVVVFSWCCVCDFVSYVHQREEGASWVNDAAEDVEKKHQSEARGVGKNEIAASGRCYMARADSVGNWDKAGGTPWEDANHRVRLGGTGTVKDPVSGDDVSDFTIFGWVEVRKGHK